jgi:hypothetical protein
MPQVGHHSKVLKRYIGQFAMLKDDYLVRECDYWLRDRPELRQSVFRYYCALGASRNRFTHLRELILGQQTCDDVSVFGAVYVIVTWTFKRQTKLLADIHDLIKEMQVRTRVQSAHVYFIGALWLAAKYSSVADLKILIRKYLELWRLYGFLARQVAGCASRYISETKFLQMVTQTLNRHGQLDALSVLENISNLALTDVASRQIRAYIVPSRLREYSLQRALIAMAVLNSKSMGKAEKADLRDKVLALVGDPRLSVLIREASTR